MISLAKFSVRRPKTALIGWLIIAGVLIAAGFGVSKTMSPSITIVPDTQSARAQQLAEEQFGPTQLVPILLEGPTAQLNKVGPKLVIALTKRPHTRALSAWDKGTASAGLRPSPTAAMIVLSVDRTEKNVVKYDQPQIESLVTREIGSAPVKSYITGQPSIDRAIKDASVNDLRQTELIAVGIVFLLLLIGLRAPVAALIVTAVGAASMLAAFGEVALLGRFMKLDVIGVAAGSMTGLAIGIGFALLIMDRFHREELPEGLPPRDGATAAVRDLETTGKAVLVGGTGLILALLLVAVIGPMELMVSVGTGATTAAIFAVGGAVVVMPAALVLLGHRINALSFPAPRFLTRAWAGLVGGGNWVTRHAIYAGFAATALLAALAIPALALDTGQPGVKTLLPKDSKARIAFEEVSRVMGPGWATPYNVIVVARNRPITTPAMLASVEKFQKQIAKDKTVYSVVGPGSINSTSTELKKFGPSLAKSAKISKQSKKDLLKLINGLGQAGSGSNQLKAGLEAAVNGANQLNGGSGQAAAGSTALHNGLMQASSGSVQLENGLNQALSGANQLKNGAGQALAGATTLGNNISASAGGIPDITGQINKAKSAASNTSSAISGAKSQASTASGAIQSAIAAVDKSDPNYGAIVASLNRASGAVSSLSGSLSTASGAASSAVSAAGDAAYSASGLGPGFKALRDSAAQLADGIGQLRNGNAQLASGISQLAGGGGQLRGGLGQLTSGAGQLEAGLALLSNGTGQLASGLSAAPTGAGQIATGLGIMQAAVTKARGQVPSTKDLEKLFKQSPGMFSSGYFVLAAVEGARGSDRNAATFAINLLRGGTAGQIVVVSKYASTDPRSDALRAHLVGMSTAFAKQQNAAVAVGGPGGGLSDLTSVTKSKIWIDVVVLAAALALVLAIGLRSIVLPAVAIVFNLLVVAAAFGVVKMLFGGSNPPLGGPGYVDPISIISIFTIAFGISIVFTTLLLMRTREAYVAGEPGPEAVKIGLRYTAAAATGAGIVMVAALGPFATTEVINVRELGVGVAAAILLDVVLFRPVLLPAVEVVLGRFGWWPTKGQRPSEPGGPGARTRRLPRLARIPRPHLPHRGPRPAAQ